ncbi:MAG TPA: hypothetical protein VN758_10350 [Solirubrobacterales bacterium]|nr:hypothetical protein [Solirubrobacterales bacterium]
MVAALTPETKVGVRFETMALPSEHVIDPRPPAPSRLSDLECARLEAKGCILSCRRAIEHFSEDPVALARAYGRGPGDRDTNKWFFPKLADVVAKEEQLIEDCEEEIREIDLRIPHLKRGVPFDFTRRSYTADPQWLREESWASETFSTQVECERLWQVEREGYPNPTAARLKEALRVDTSILEVGDEDIPDREKGPGFYTEQVDGVARVSILAMVAEAAHRNPQWWRRTKDLGATPEVIQEMKQILRRQRHHRAHSESIRIVRHTCRLPVRARSRCSRGPARRSSGTASKSRARGGDPPGGDADGPGERPRQGLAGLLAIFALLAFGLVAIESPSAYGGDPAMKYESSGEDFTYPSMRPFRPAPDSRFRQLQPELRSAAEGLFNDPRRFAEDKDQVVSQYHDWWSEVACCILERSSDAYDPRDSYLTVNLGPQIAETLSDEEMLWLLRALLDGDVSTATSSLGRVTRHSERNALKHRHDSYEHYEPRRMANGELRIVMDQRHASRLRLRSRTRLGPLSISLVAQRTRRRSRASHASSSRTRGSRRVTSRCAGGGSSGDDPGGSDEPPGGGLQLHFHTEVLAPPGAGY